MLSCRIFTLTPAAS
jgi:hypothetical protein